MSVLAPAHLPTLPAVFMAAALSILLLFVARVLFLVLRPWATPSDPADKTTFSLTSVSKPWAPWNTLPASLPFALAFPEKQQSPESGNCVPVGLTRKPHMFPVGNWQPRTGPQFHHPPPALYESPVPLSMAKMIMSRHTFRRPNPNRPRRSSTASSSRPTSPPQTPSRLYHSIA